MMDSTLHFTFTWLNEIIKKKVVNVWCFDKDVWVSARILHVLLHLSFLCDFYDIFLLVNTVTPKPVMGPQEGVKFQQINIWKNMFKNLPRGTICTI